MDWGERFVPITESDRKLFREARRSFLFHDGEIWVKTKTPHFDVGMGSFDGAEVCEIVGLFLLNEILAADIGLRRGNMGLYRDDGLGVAQGSGRQMDKLTASLQGIFARHGLSIKDEHSMPKVNFLDLTLHLKEKIFEPFRKENNDPLYINKNSNHPPAIIKNMPRMIEKMWADSCSNQDIFNRTKKVVSEPLKAAGYDSNINHVPSNGTLNAKTTKPRRYKYIFWWNPPYNMKVATKVGKRFLEAITKCFKKGTFWAKHFNRHTVKMSYSGTNSLATKIAQHNANVNRSKPRKKAGCCCLENKVRT